MDSLNSLAVASSSAALDALRSPLQILVVGGGAAGFFGAIACAQAHPQSQITLLEAGRQPLAKVRVSGGGRCNVTHACFEPATLIQHYPRGGKALRGAFSRFQPRDTVRGMPNRGSRSRPKQMDGCFRLQMILKPLWIA